jgi:branched-chain amino acid transport system substrate-binding protein
MKRALTSLPLALLLMLMAACANQEKPRPIEAASVQPQASAPPKPLELPEDTKQRHRIALLVPLSGVNGRAGNAIANAANLAIVDTNNTKLRLTVYDTSSGVEAAAQKAISENNQLILGPIVAEEVKAVVRTAKPLHIPVISFSNDASLAEEGVWLLGFSPAQSVARVVQYAQAHEIRTLVALRPQGLYGERVTTALLQSTNSMGQSVIAVIPYSNMAAVQTSAAKKANDMNADALLIADTRKTAAHLVAQYSKAKHPQILGTELWGVDPAPETNAPLLGAWYASVPEDNFPSFTAHYRALYGKAPLRIASLGYDALLLVDKIAANWKPERPFPATRLYDKTGYAGVDGIFRFQANGVAERGLQVNQIEKTGVSIISKAPDAW